MAHLTYFLNVLIKVKCIYLIKLCVCVCARAQVRFKKTLGAKKFNSEPNTLSLLVQSHKHLEKAMTLHSSTLAWKIPWMEEPGRLPSMGSHRVGHD